MNFLNRLHTSPPTYVFVLRLVGGYQRLFTVYCSFHLSHVLVCTAQATYDPVDYVRRDAIGALHQLLLYDSCRPTITDAGLTAHLVRSVALAGQCDMDTDTRCVYYDSVAQLVKVVADFLTSDDMDRLLPLLVDAWKSQR